MFNNVKSIYFRGKEVKQITRYRDGAILYQSNTDKIICWHEQDFHPLDGTTSDTIGIAITDNFGELIREQRQIKIYKNNNLFTTITTNAMGVYILYDSNNSFSEGDVIYCVDETNEITSEQITVKKPYNDWIELEVTIEDSNYPLIDSFWGNSVILNKNDVDRYRNIYINWGDGSTFDGGYQFETVTPSSPYYGYEISHAYENPGTYTIKMYGNIETKNPYMFGYLEKIKFSNTVKNIGLLGQIESTSLKEVRLSKSISFIQDTCFGNFPQSLEKIYFNWTNANDILPYNPKWFYKRTSWWQPSDNWTNGQSQPTSESQQFNENLKFIVPQGTERLYIEKGYPIDKIFDDYTEITYTPQGGNPNLYIGYEGYNTFDTEAFIDWGKGDAIERIAPNTSYIYDGYDQGDTYIIKIYGNYTSIPSIPNYVDKIKYKNGIENIGEIIPDAVGPLQKRDTLKEIHIPKSVRYITYSLEACTSLEKLYLNWDSDDNDEIIYFDSLQIEPGLIDLEILDIIIPEGTEALYINKGYPFIHHVIKEEPEE